MASSFFRQASHISIQSNEVNFIAGNQYTTNVNHLSSVESERTISPGVGQSIFDEYEIIRRGNLRLLHEISSQAVDEVSVRKWRYTKDLPRKALVYKKTVYRAIIIGRRDIPECIAVAYMGKDGYAAWERDLTLFSHHHPNIAHLFGLNLSSPTLIFCDDLIPVKYLWNRSSAIVKCYITHRVAEDTKDICFNGEFSSLMGYNSHFECINYTFIQPHTGLACIAPFQITNVDHSGDLILNHSSQWNAEEYQPLPLCLYNNGDSVLKYLLQWSTRPKDSSPELVFHKFIASNHIITFYQRQELPISLPFIFSGYPNRPNGHFRDFNTGPSNSNGSKKSSKMAMTRAYQGKWEFGEVFRGQNIPQTIAANGWTRISLSDWWKLWNSSPSKRFDCPHFDPLLRLGVHLNNQDEILFSTAWLSQAQYFHNAINKDLHTPSLDYDPKPRLVQHVFFELERRDKNVSFRLPGSVSNVFLFIAPVAVRNLPGQSSMTINWGDNGDNIYYWSFDPDGSHPLSERAAEVLGLPNLMKTVKLALENFEYYQYEAAQQFQSLRGYNPLTQEFAKKYGLPLVEIMQPLPGVCFWAEIGGPLLRIILDGDGDVWYDAKDTLECDTNSAFLAGLIEPFLIPAQFLYELKMNNCPCYGCENNSRCYVQPWLHGFLPDFDLKSWSGFSEIWPLGERGLIGWKCNHENNVKLGPGVGKKAGRTRSASL